MLSNAVDIPKVHSEWIYNTNLYAIPKTPSYRYKRVFRGEKEKEKREEEKKERTKERKGR